MSTETDSAIFAYALWVAHGRPINSGISILTDSGAYPDTPPVWHVFFSLEGNPIDAKGMRATQKMSNEFGLHSYRLKKLMHPEDFRKGFPLDDTAVRNAIQQIEADPKRYGLTRKQFQKL